MDDLASKHSNLVHSLKFDSYDDFIETLFLNEEYLNLSNSKGETLLHYACYLGLLEKYYALFNFGCEFKNTIEDNDPLHYACIGGKDPFMIIELIKNGLNPIKKNIHGETAFHLTSDSKICNYLHMWSFKHQIKIIDLLDNDGNTILHSSYKYGHNDSSLYWIKEFPILENATNHNNILPHQLSHTPINICQ